MTESKILDQLVAFLETQAETGKLGHFCYRWRQQDKLCVWRSSSEDKIDIAFSCCGQEAEHIYHALVAKISSLKLPPGIKAEANRAEIHYNETRLQCMERQMAGVKAAGRKVSTLYGDINLYSVGEYKKLKMTLLQREIESTETKLADLKAKLLAVEALV